MKRMLTGAAVSAALLAPAIADAARSTHTGKLIGVPGSSVKFKESTGASGHRVTSFAVRDFEMDCEGDIVGIINRTKLAGDIDVSATGGFKATDDDGETTFKVKGQIRRNKSFGTFRYFGEIPVEGGGTADCDSGRLTWVTRP
jgi:hypothetical protein